MSSALRIAVVDRDDSGLTARLGEVPGPPEVRRFPDAVEAAATLHAWRPDALLVHCPEGPGEALCGALQVLRALLPELRLALIVPPQREPGASEPAARLGARVLTTPVSHHGLLDVLALTDVGNETSSPAEFLTLARGLSDEVNNPLLFVSGHLQLLESLCDPTQDADKLDQLVAVRRGLERIAATMEKIRIMNRARSLLGPLPATRADELLDRAFAELPAAARERLRDHLPADRPGVPLSCDEPLMVAAFRHFLEVGAELSRIAEDTHLELTSDQSEVVLALTLTGLAVEDWQLPRTFQPYHLRGALRGTVHGLNLFLVQSVVHAHGGTASARRIDARSVILELRLPRQG